MRLVKVSREEVLGCPVRVVEVGGGLRVDGKA